MSLVLNKWALVVLFSVMIATEKEMDDADMPTLKRDYCAHLYIAWKQCHMEKGGLYCHKEKHDYSHCEHEE